MTFLDRRDLLAGATALFGTSLVAPLARAAEVQVSILAPGMGVSHAFLTSDQRSQVAAMAERIIPTTDTPGAIAAGVPAFIEMMLADWYESTDRNDFMRGLGLVEGYARVQYEKPCAQLTEQEQDAVLTLAMEGKINALPRTFFEHFRQLVLLGYYSSEIGCKQERVYVPVPGRYDGRYPYADVRRVFSS
jgi:gluconate 2-dehydrogenase gamma chain